MQRYFSQADELEKRPSLRSVYACSHRKPSNIYAESLDAAGRIHMLRYADAKICTERYAAALSSLLPRSKRGAFVGLALPNSPEWGCVFWALLMCGYCPVIMDPALNVSAASRILLDADAAAVVCVEERTELPVPCIPFSLLLTKRESIGAPEWANCIAFCSSGTTGEISVNVFDGRSVVAQILAARSMPAHTKDLMYPDEEGPLKVAVLLPFYHIFGFTAVFLWYTFFQKTLVFPPDLVPKHVFACCRKLGVTHVFCVPAFWNGIASYIRRRAAGKGPEALLLTRIIRAAGCIDQANAHNEASSMVQRFAQRRLLGSAVRFCITGGGCISESTLRCINALGYPLHNGYGLTEAGVTSVDLSASAAERIGGFVGAPLWGVLYDISLEGELLLHGVQVSPGVMHEGKFYPRSLKAGFLATGDTARMEGDAYRITGRCADRIVTSGGESLSPDELELPFAELEGVAHCSVCGITDASAGEVPVLVFEPTPGWSESELARLCGEIASINAALPQGHMLRKLYVATAPLPITNTAKVCRNRVRTLLEEGKLPCYAVSLSESGVNALFPIAREVPNALLQSVRAVFSEILTLDRKTIGPDAHFVLDLGGDSLQYAELVVEIEQRFGIAVPPSYYAKCATVSAFAQLILLLKDSSVREA